MSYLVLSRNGEESFNNFLSPDLDTDHLRGGKQRSANNIETEKLK